MKEVDYGGSLYLYTKKLKARFRELELTKIEYPGFIVKDIWKLNDDILAEVDNLIPLIECGGKWVTEKKEIIEYGGIKWYSADSVEKGEVK